MKFWQRFNKNTFRGIAAALVVAAAVMGGTDAALAAGEPVTEEQTKIISASLLQAGGTVFLPDPVPRSDNIHGLIPRPGPDTNRCEYASY